MSNREMLSDAGDLLKTGYTTGSCATAAASVAVLILRRVHKSEIPNKQEIVLPNGAILEIPIERVEINADGSVTGVVIKDAGDDQDVTNGLEIHATVKWSFSGQKISISGGEGVGTVTREGLQTPVGSSAINPTPLKMIEDNVKRLMTEVRGIDIEITVPKGREIAKKTFNERLGIVGGISIIGTSGIVRPMSEEAFKDSIFVELKQKFALGIRTLYLVPGMHGEKFAHANFKADEHNIVHMSNFVGFTLRAAEKLGFEKLVIVGHVGKLIKLAGGIFNTHSKVADGKSHIMAAHLALLGASQAFVSEIYEANTTDEMADKLFGTSYFSVFEDIVQEAKRRCLMHLDNLQALDVVMYDMKGRLLANTLAGTSAIDSVDAMGKSEVKVRTND